MTIGENIKKLRAIHKVSQIQLAKFLDVTDKAVSSWENNLKTPRMTTINKIAEYFKVSISTIIENDVDISIFSNVRQISFKKIPVIGKIACGTPILAEQNITHQIDCEHSINADFALYCKGDSMINARIFDGDIVFIKEQQVVENGKIAAICIDEFDTTVTLKRVYINNNTITLLAENPKYPPLVFTKEEASKIRIIGKAIAFQSIIT